MLSAAASAPAASARPGEAPKDRTPPPPMAPPASAQTPAFFDDFNGPAGSAPDSAHWAVVTGPGWGGQQTYTTGNAYLDGNSNLVLKAVNNDGSWEGGRVQTALPRYPANNQASAGNLVTFGYGKLSARIQLPYGMGAGLWPAFWLLGANAADGVAWPFCGEITVFEFTGVGTKAYTAINGPFAEILRWDVNQARLRTVTPDLSTAFHTFWVVHAQDNLVFGVDDTTWGTFTPSSAKPGSLWVHNQPYYLILNLAVGSAGSWVGGPDATTPSPAMMLVDWVKFEPA